MTKGQKVMALAMIYPEGRRGGAKDRGLIARNLGLSGERIRQARMVLRVTPDVAPAVVAGAVKLDDAYEGA
jgi:hypothetical protein